MINTNSATNPYYKPPNTVPITSGYKIDIDIDTTDPNNPTYMFKPLASDISGDGTFYSGFLADADNTNGGINLKAWAAGSGSNTIKTIFLAGFQGNTGVVYRMISSSEGGGKIETTNTGNKSGKLNEGDVIGEGTLSVPSPYEITYTMTPDRDDIFPEEVTVIDGLDPTQQSTGLYNERTWKYQEILDEISNNPTGPWQKHKDANGMTCYTYKFELSNSGLSAAELVKNNHEIHVKWDHRYLEFYEFTDWAELPPQVKALRPAKKYWYKNGNDVYPLYPGQVNPSDPAVLSIDVGNTRYTFNNSQWDYDMQTVNNAHVYFKGNWIKTDISGSVPINPPAPGPNPPTPNPPAPAPQPVAQTAPDPTPAPVVQTPPVPDPEPLPENVQLTPVTPPQTDAPARAPLYTLCAIASGSAAGLFHRRRRRR